MVFSGEVEDYTATNTRRERRKTRHNFTLPDLKWGVQRSLRCINLQSHGGVDNGGEEGIEEYGEKIISDVRTEAEKKMKESILREVSPPGVAAEVKPWNLRKRRAACKAPPEPGNCNEVKFVSTLLKKEMEDDYMTMMGQRPPRRPKKRLRAVQKQINLLHPAFYFSEVTEDIYEVPEAVETRKR